MSETLTAEQNHAKATQAMGAEIGELFNPLSDELTLLHWRWQQYVALFATRPDRLDVMNRAAPFFFWVVQGMFWDSTLLGIARLAGPPSSAGKPNLAIQRLIGLLPQSMGPIVDPLAETMKNSTDFAIEWRHRRIAHHDLALALAKSAAPLPEANRKHVDAALESMAAVLNAISHHFMRSTTAYHWATSAYGAESLLHVVREGFRSEDLRQARLERGEILEEDWDMGAAAV